MNSEHMRTMDKTKEKGEKTGQKRVHIRVKKCQSKRILTFFTFQTPSGSDVMLIEIKHSKLKRVYTYSLSVKFPDLSILCSISLGSVQAWRNYMCRVKNEKLTFNWLKH